ncbi:hypothetical protein C8A00DRAFT_17514 [Chaetomidium leptoderma]|uniref:Chromosome transmission fidelity protein 4 n=1 Tax=Chaetomidium leptoderma TaxID=669021 RepID=A0AAN6VGU5_9PEZI|nr:hypothetical protein C8A00DRAFT_17514 [Chaetomidium leptoderma]
MCAPARSLRSPLHGYAALTSATAACAAASPWARGASPAIDRRQWPSHTQPAAPPVLYLSTTTRPPRTSPQPNPSKKGLTTLQEPPNPLPEVSLFTAHPPLLSPEPGNNKAPDERKVKLGKTLRTLQPRLPTLLQSPLPQQILSPHITLHLFPSTHPHLPTVTGRVAYIAALWSSPIAWNRVPLVGNVRLEILSERGVDSPSSHSYYASCLPGGRRPEGACGEQLIVRWRTVGGGGGKLRGWLNFGGGGEGGGGGGGGGGYFWGGGGGGKGGVKGGGNGSEGIQEGKQQDAGGGEVKAPVGMAQPVGSSNKEFTGLFIFDFDSEGRILSHTIEHVQEGGQWEKGMGAKVVGLTDWLLGGIKGGDAPCPAFARARFRKGRWS